MLHVLLGALLLSLAVWAVLQPPHPWVWVLSVLVKEWGWVGALLCLPLVYPPLISGWVAALGALLALIAMILFLAPLAAGVGFARRLPPDPWGEPPGPGERPRPFVWKDLWLGVRTPRFTPETLTYDVLPDGKPLRMDVYRPAKPGPAPVVLVIHGGGWRSGDRKQLPKLNHYLAAQGYLVAAAEYRLAPSHRFPGARDDVFAAIRYIKENAAVLGADPQRIVLLGRSAGGHLALVAGYTARDPAIRGVISYYGPFSLTWGWQQKTPVLNIHEVMGGFLGGGPDDVPEIYREAEPLQLVHADVPPTLLIQGDADTMVAPTHCDHLIERLGAAGASYEYVLVPHATHASDANFTGPFGQISTFAVERFLKHVMK